jgi:hypothetical protein
MPSPGAIRDFARTAKRSPHRYRKLTSSATLVATNLVALQDVLDKVRALEIFAK